MKLLIGITLWLTCSFFAYGLSLGQFTNEFPDQDEMAFVVPWSLFGGPFSLIVAATMSIENQHWLLKPYTTEQKWQYFNKMYPELGRDYFDREH